MNNSVPFYAILTFPIFILGFEVKMSKLVYEMQSQSIEFSFPAEVVLWFKLISFLGPPCAQH